MARRVARAVAARVRWAFTPSRYPVGRAEGYHKFAIGLTAMGTPAVIAAAVLAHL